MIDIKVEDVWHSEHAAHLRQFLDTPTGKLMLDVLDALKPRYQANAARTEFIATAACRREGFEKALQTLVLLTHPDFLKPAESTPSAYPPLNDDSKWDSNNQPRS